MLDLAQCDDFAIGRVTIRPSSRELIAGGVATMIAPKVMQVLVAIARGGGRVVSRDELVAQCWPGRIVGDDAINRIIGKLRRALATLGPGVFGIETVARSGYRLRDGDAVAATPTDPPASTALPMLADPVRPPPRTIRRLAWVLPVVAAVALLVVMRVAPHGPVPPPALPAAVTDLETRGLSAMFDDTAAQTHEGVGYLRRATALEPRVAPVWGSLAMSYVLELGWLPSPDRAAGVTRVRDAAAHGLALDGYESRSIAALASLVPTFGNWADKAAALHAADRRADGGPLAYQRVQFLLAIGQTRAALAEVTRLARSSPLVPWIRAMQIDLLAAAGRLDEADQVATEAATIWPHDRLMWFTRFDLAAFNGQADRALAMAADRAGWPHDTDAADISLAAEVARAAASRDPAAIDTVLRHLQAARPGHASAERTMRAAAALGRPDAVATAARQLYFGRIAAAPRATMLPAIGLPGDGDPPTAALFLPPVAAIWTTPVLAPVLIRSGLATYWRQTAPPDICATSAARPTCQAIGVVR